MTLKSLLILVFFTTFLQVGNTQEISVDSLEGMSFEDILIKLKSTNVNDSLNYSRIANVYLKKSLKTRDSIQMCRGYYFYARNLKPETALKYADTIISLSKNSKHELYPTAGYILKANTYEDVSLYEDALKNHIIALEYAQIKNNMGHIFHITERIANLKSISGENKEALKIYKNIYNTFNTHPNYKKEYSLDYAYLLYGLIIDQINVKSYDSANIYIKRAFKENEIYKSKINNIHYHDFVYLSGINNYYKKNYSQSMDSLIKAIPKIDDHGKAFAYFLLSNIYKLQNKSDLFISNAIIADSLANKSDNTSKELRELYENLINHYKNKKDTKNHLKYLNRLIQFDSIEIKDSELKTQIFKKYDTPQLLKEKQKIINQLNTKTQRDRNIKIGLISTVLLLLVGGGYYFKKQRLYLKKYKALIANTKTVSHTPTPIPETNKTELSTVVLEEINQGLLKFENNQGFLESKLTLAKLAEQLNTNSNYLSKAVNLLKNESFSNYLHTLRINYIVERLKTDDTLKRYTIKAIAVEAGYGNSQSFSTAFYKQTGIYPSYFLNKLNKEEELV